MARSSNNNSGVYLLVGYRIIQEEPDLQASEEENVPSVEETVMVTPKKKGVK